MAKKTYFENAINRLEADPLMDYRLILLSKIIGAETSVQSLPVKGFDKVNFVEKPNQEKAVVFCFNKATKLLKYRKNLNEGLAYLAYAVITALYNQNGCFADKRVLTISRELIDDVVVKNTEELIWVKHFKGLLYLLDLKCTVMQCKR